MIGTERGLVVFCGFGDARQTPLTPEQLAAVQEGAGFARLQDPVTGKVFVVIEQVAPTIDEAYVQSKIDEAQASIDRGETADWDVDEIKTELYQRLAKRKDERS